MILSREKKNLIFVAIINIKTSLLYLLLLHVTICNLSCKDLYIICKNRCDRRIPDFRKMPVAARKRSCNRFVIKFQNRLHSTEAEWHFQSFMRRRQSEMREWQRFSIECWINNDFDENNDDIDTLITCHKHSYYRYINSSLKKANTLFTKIDRSYCSTYRVFKERKNMRNEYECEWMRTSMYQIHN